MKQESTNRHDAPVSAQVSDPVSDPVLASIPQAQKRSHAGNCDEATALSPDAAGSLTPDGRFVPVGREDSLPSWQTSMKNAVRSASQLRRVLEGCLPVLADSCEPPSPSPEGLRPGAQITRDDDHDFPVFVPLEFIARMDPNDPHDPLLKQVLPDAREGDDVPGFSDDPVGDLDANVAPGLLHKYAGRALMITTGACGVHCRYCFRRQFPYIETAARRTKYAPAIEYLQNTPDVEEVLLSGGDPLTLTDGALSDLIGRVETVDHVRRLRLHTRMPIVIPSRVTDELLARLKSSRLTVWLVVHVNHPNELDASTENALSRFIDAGIPVLNQAVLLRGVNDDADTLEALCRQLIDIRVMPYYLHQLDRVRGAAHFEVSTQRGLELVAQLESRLPGYAVPRFVCEQPGQSSKTHLYP